MIIVDDKLSLDALAGGFGTSAVATTWCFHYRLLRALSDTARWGALSKVADPGSRRVAADPPAERLTVLDPRLVTERAADLAVRHGLNLLAAELFASAVHYGAEVHLSARNVGRSWREVAAAEGVALVIA